MGLDFDLATVAGLTGLGASTLAALSAAFFFRGLITRVLTSALSVAVNGIFSVFSSAALFLVNLF